MRYTSFALALMLTTGFVSPALAQQARGMNKHDASIANYNYQVPIVMPSSSGGTLKDDIDRGAPGGAHADHSHATPHEAAPSLGDAQPLQRPATGTLQPIAVGAQAPYFNLPRAMGGYQALNGLLEKGPTLVMFIRGTFSPYSFQQLQLLQKNLSQFQQLGIQVVAITPDPLDSLQRAQQNHGFGFDILSDSGSAIARQYGILEITEPTPALFSLDQQGRVAAIQLQPQMKSVFDLSEAAAPLRPQLVATPPVAAVPSAGETVDAPKRVIPAVPAPNTQGKPVPELLGTINDGAHEAPVAPRVNYVVPPSNPDFGKAATQKAQTI